MGNRGRPLPDQTLHHHGSVERRSQVLEDKELLQTDYDDMEKERELSWERFRLEILDLKSKLFAVQSKISTAYPRAQTSSAEQNETEVARESILPSLIDENPFRPLLSLELRPSTTCRRTKYNKSKLSTALQSILET
ncbi:Aste57867_15580 [Aphanomyces stellatus]|uniref:Aste57867_15580 protein n=1 Tax=Aphanomyces stellatus TaxID=120398 RepID=A0A485L3R3_9STRA|nr:hypothetical protein As57867_015524 [Aphanomyces stellatus]VFT92382.1 Aste57867_15580 [Aphanomyces stellatus]